MRFLRKAIRFVGLFLLVALAFSFYSIYTEFYQGVRASESYGYAKAVAASAAEYFSIHSNYPGNIDDLNLHERDLSYVGAANIDKQTGIIEIRLAGNSMDEGALIFTPRVASNAPLEYECQSIDVPTRYIPKGCFPKDAVFNPATQPSAHGGS